MKYTLSLAFVKYGSELPIPLGVYTHEEFHRVNQDFYNQRTFYKNPFYLYNAFYVWDYFRFSASSDADSVKVLALPDEDPDPYFRDYAGADLTAWIYDLQPLLNKKYYFGRTLHIWTQPENQSF